jgi:hypothetical protein
VSAWLVLLVVLLIVGAVLAAVTIDTIRHRDDRGPDLG